MLDRKPLSSYPTARAWLSQFNEDDKSAAASLLDAMLLLNEEEVSAALRSQLYELAKTRRGRHRRIALYAEREFGGAKAFDVQPVLDSSGRVRMRAVGRIGPPAVRPARGSPRVGSEGLVAFVISQAKETWPTIFMNHPGPDLIRGKTNPAGTICLVTDFIGSGKRVSDMLDAFWRVSSVRAWVSRRWVDFKVIAAAATSEGAAKVRLHRLRPGVASQYVAPTIGAYPDWSRAGKWRSLIDTYGPDEGRGTGRYGFGDDGALIAFNYRLPNNTPALIHQTTGEWRALYEGAAPADLRPAFGLRSTDEVIAQAATATGVDHVPGCGVAGGIGRRALRHGPG
ncbi:hypothetical protein P9272_35795 [Mesorhizobium sp. WSM4976]|uniref:phosphoribosyltransferase-like protein n=1 Tax=Mesorhizobium sp. WSM4976 TaxID=3038549 RepID=UPI00241622C0|nr:hypothetical protein [Mesorhizobium sp. WSM4976]MDG4898845.1 hypothetical protein [Mesorhizobium sp. WSM4976]